MKLSARDDLLAGYDTAAESKIISRGGGRMNRRNRVNRDLGCRRPAMFLLLAALTGGLSLPAAAQSSRRLASSACPPSRPPAVPFPAAAPSPYLSASTLDSETSTSMARNIEGAPQAKENVRGLLVFRISNEFIRGKMEEQVHRRAPVDRTIEGTRNRGTSTTVAQMTVATQMHDSAIAFQVQCQGTVDAHTVGHNGPARLRSHSRTTFTARTPIVFDGTQFRRGALDLQTDTKLQILGVGSTLPGLRGMVVTNVARRRAQQKLPRAQAISAHLTREELRESMEQSIEDGLKELNESLQTRRLLSFLMRSAEGRWIRLSSSEESLQIAWYPLLNADDVPRCPVDRGSEAPVQLWIHAGVAEVLGIDALPAVNEDYYAWLRLLIPNASLAKETGLANVLSPVWLARLDDWYVVQITPPDA